MAREFKMKNKTLAPLLLFLSISICSVGYVAPLTSSPAHTTLLQQPNLYFNPPTPLNGSYTSSGVDEAPASIVTADGTLWVAWDSNRGGSYQVYYQTYNGISWTPPTSVSTAGYNSAPALAQLANGTVVLTWAGGTNGSDDHLYFRSFAGGAWRSIVQLTSGTTFTDEEPSAVVTRDSTLWIFFERDTSTGSSTPPNKQIYYKTLNGNRWSADTILTTDNAMNQQPSATTLRSGNIWLAWVRNATSGNRTIYYRAFDGNQWSGDTALTSPALEASPNLVQDRNGTIWLIWSQTLQLNATVSQDQLLYQTSTDVGRTWTPATNLTMWGDANGPINSLNPFAVQGVDTSLYIFFSTDVAQPTGFGFHIYYLQSSSIYPVYDVGISRIQTSPTKNYPYGDAPTSIATITVTLQNYGDASETLTVTLQASNTTFSPTIYSLGSKTATVLASISATLTFTWNVTGLHPGRYTVQASFPRFTGQTLGNSQHDTVTAKSGVIVLYAGDVLHTGIVNINNESVMGGAWQATPGSPRWNPDCDILRKGIVNINDESVAAGNWQKSI